MKKSAEASLDSRGMDNSKLIEEYRELDFAELTEKLKSLLPAERTAAARVLSSYKTDECALILSQALAKEKKLYSKIAISETLGQLGIISLKYLLPLLGKIGTNQHKTIPEEKFRKKSFPLPRDIVSRTITKIGEEALAPLEKFIMSKDDSAVSEALDSYGFILFYGNNKCDPSFLLRIYGKTKSLLIKWKIIRALESFDDNETIIFLKDILNDNNLKILHSEAERSLSQISKKKGK